VPATAYVAQSLAEKLAPTSLKLAYRESVAE